MSIRECITYIEENNHISFAPFLEHPNLGEKRLNPEDLGKPELDPGSWQALVDSLFHNMRLHCVALLRGKGPEWFLHHRYVKLIKRCRSESQLPHEAGERISSLSKNNLARLKEYITQTECTAKTDHIFPQRFFRVLTSRTVPKTLSKEIQKKIRASFLVTDFYYLFHLLRSISQSEDESSKLKEMDATVSQKLANLLHTNIWDTKCKNTNIYNRFIICRDRVLFTLARNRGVVPYSFFVTGFVQIGDHPVGCGGFADVWKGCMKTFKPRHAPLVALKVLRPIGTLAGESDARRQARTLCREAVLWKMANHPNVLQFIGLCRLNDARGSIALVSPWLRHGNLMEYVQSHHDADRPNLVHTS